MVKVSLFNSYHFLGAKKLTTVFSTKFGAESQSHIAEFNTKMGSAVGGIVEFGSLMGSSRQGIAEFATNFNLLDHTPYITDFSSKFAVRSVFANIIPVINSPVVTVDGVQIVTKELSISNDESRTGYSARISVADRKTISHVKRNSQVVVTIGSKVYSFIVDTIPTDKDGIVAPDITVQCVSPLMNFDEPRAPKISKTWDKPVQASTVAAELLGLVIWTAEDWVIPEFRLAVESQTPLQIVRKIAEACGAIVTAEPNGTAVVQSEFPVSTNKYDDVTPDHVFNDVDHITRTMEEGIPEDGTNYVLVSDVRTTDSSQGTDQMEFDVTSPEGGMLSIYPSPVRSLVVRHTAKEPLTITPVTDLASATKEETIEVFKGVGRLRYPIDSIKDIEFVSLSITGLTYEKGSNTIYTENLEAYGVVKVKYKTQVKQYRVSGVTAPQIQFLLEEAK